MRIILGEGGKPAGFTEIECDGYVESDLKPLSDGESAVWNGKEFEYSFLDRIEKMQDSGEKSTEEGAVKGIQSAVYSAITPISSGKSWQFREGEKAAVLIPCLGKAEYVLAAARSCARQTRMPDEIHILLMDEESAQKRQELEEVSSRVKCHEHERMNAAEARTYLAQLTEAEWIVFLDADDMLAENFIEETSRHRCAVCYPAISILTGAKAEDFECRKDLADIHPANAVCQNLTALMRREAFLQTGLDPELAEGGEDLDFLLRLFEEKKFLAVHTSGTRYFWRQEVDGQLTARKGFFVSSLKMLFKHREFLAEELEWLGRLNKAQMRALWFLRNWTDKNLILYSQVPCLSCTDSYGFHLKKIAPLAVNALRNLAQISRTRITRSVFRPEDYTAEGGASIEEAMGHIEGRSFDAVIFNPVDPEQPCDMFLMQPQMIARKSLIDEMDGLGIEGLDRVFYLLGKYSCFVFPRQRSRERIFAADSRAEEAWQTVCGMKFLPDEIKTRVSAYTEFMRTGEFYTTSLNPLQKATFILNRKCNRSCEYCLEKEMESSCDLADDEIFSRFDTALCELEKLTGGRLVPHLMGGEPTIWSEKLTERIIERLKGYREVYVFTNGANRKSKFFEQPNFKFLTHLVDWKGKEFSGLEILPNELVNICVLKSELGDLEKFIETIPEDENKDKVYFQPCQSQNAEWNMDEEGFERLSEILLSHEIPSAVIQYAENLKNFGAEFVQRNCAQGQGVWNVDCISLKISPCCNMKNAVPLEEFNPARAKDCAGCLNFGNTCW